MTIPTFPTLAGLAFPVKKTPNFQSIVHASVSGVTTAQATQPYATYSYDLPFEFLRADDVNAELQSLMSFYQRCMGRALPFHFSDPDDNSVTLQALGTGDGVTTDFAFVRTMGGNVVDPIQDINSGTLSVFKNGVLQTAGSDYIVLPTAQYGTVYGARFTVAPAGGLPITATFTYNFLCRFDMDAQEFSKFTRYLNRGLFEAKSVKFTSLLQ